MATTFKHENCKVPLTLWFKFWFLNDIILVRGTHGKSGHYLDANYSIKHNSKVLIKDILDVDMCLKKRNLKKKL